MKLAKEILRISYNEQTSGQKFVYVFCTSSAALAFEALANEDSRASTEVIHIKSDVWHIIH